jgi:thioredoxin reductase
LKPTWKDTMDLASTPDLTCEAAVIGGGAAGLAAALLLARARRDVVVIDGGQPRNAPSAHTRGFLTRDDATPQQLLDQARQEVSGYGARILDAAVDRLDADRVLHLSDGTRLRAERVILATGLTDLLPDIPGLRERWGRDVLHCPYCHGYDAGQGAFVVLGTHPNAVHHALLLKQWTSEVTLAVHELTLHDEDRAALSARGVDLIDGMVEAVVVEDDVVAGVRVDGALVPATTVFLFPVPQPQDGFTQELALERDRMGFPVTDEMGRTCVPWLFAAGNAADPRAQTLAAAGHGQQVAFAMHNAWVQDEVATALAAGQRT